MTVPTGRCNHTRTRAHERTGARLPILLSMVAVWALAGFLPLHAGVPEVEVITEDSPFKLGSYQAPDGSRYVFGAFGGPVGQSVKVYTWTPDQAVWIPQDLETGVLVFDLLAGGVNGAPFLFAALSRDPNGAQPTELFAYIPTGDSWQRTRLDDGNDGQVRRIDGHLAGNTVTTAETIFDNSQSFPNNNRIQVNSYDIDTGSITEPTVRHVVENVDPQFFPGIAGGPNGSITLHYASSDGNVHLANLSRAGVFSDAVVGTRSATPFTTTASASSDALLLFVEKNICETTLRAVPSTDLVGVSWVEFLANGSLTKVSELPECEPGEANFDDLAAWYFGDTSENADFFGIVTPALIAGVKATPPASGGPLSIDFSAVTWESSGVPPRHAPIASFDPVALQSSGLPPGGLISEGSTEITAFDPFEIFGLEPSACQASASSHCLNGGRFRTDVTWTDTRGNSGTGQVVPGGSDDSGLFYFFSPDNWEMLVKVLRGCGVNGHHWVLAASTTNLGLDLTVTDTETGDTFVASTTPGIAAPAIVNVRAFPCDDSQQRSTFASPQRQAMETAAEITELGQLVASGAPPQDRLSETVAGGLRVDSSATTCAATDHALCLTGSRFLVEVSWIDFAGNRGSGQVVPVGSESSGLFSFFDPENWEMLVKVLPACGVNGHNWVFAAATTTVEYTLRVTDSLTAEVREYRNPLGVAASAITDTAAFATCPAQ